MKKLSFFLMAMLMSIMSFAETYTHTFVKGEMKTGSVTLSGVTWNTAADPSTTAYNWDSNATAKGIQIGTSKAPCASYTFSTSHFADYTITNITVNASTASSGTAKMQVSVGGVDYIAQTALTTAATDYNGSGASQGDVVISFTNTAKAFYIKSISITYQEAGGSSAMILVNKTNVDFGKVSKTQTITVSGKDLTSAITTKLQDGSHFSIEGELTKDGGDLTINFTATETGKYTDVLVLTSDDVTAEVALAGEIVALDGQGTKEAPYSVEDVITLALTDKTPAWVEGYIVGVMKNNEFSTDNDVASNLVIAASVEDAATFVPVALPSGDVRTALNLVDNPTMLGAKVAVYGTLETYFSKPGVKNVSDYEILSTVTPEPVMFTVTATAENGTVEGAGDYAEGTEVTLTATAAEGYEFVNWTSGETEVSTANPFTFTVTSDTTLVANFKEVEPVKLYLNAKDWGYGDARFAAYFFEPAKWVDMTKVEGETYIYEVEVPAGYTQVIFVRMNGNTTENNWDNKWNQTGNLTIPTDGRNMFKPDDWNDKTTTWSTYTPSVKYTFTEGSTWYIDFSAITGKKGANYPKTNVADIDYSANAGGTVIPVTFTADVTWAEGATFIKTEEGGWDALTFTTPTEGANCAQVAADGKSYTWTTYVPVVEPEVIAYELNGGELPTATVPTQDSLIAAFKDGYNAYFGVSVATTRAIDNFLYAGAAVNVPTCDVSLFMKDDASPWKWLGDYVLAVTNAQIEAGTLSTLKELATELMWRQSLTGFFLQQTKLDYNYKGNADFTEAGKPEAWGAAYQAAHAVVLPTEPVDAPYTLPTPVKDGFTFVGWYDNAEGTGEAYTVIPAGWSGTLYAIWKQSPATALENIAVEGKAVKAIINGQLIIIKNGVQYNAQGAVVK